MGTGITTINSLGLAGMQTAQTGMANVATNVSGASVDGFHRREVHPQMSSASTNPLVQGGTVIIDSVMRSYSSLLSMQYLENHGKVKQASSLNVAAEVVDKMLVDESTGLTDVFNGFFTAASDLSADPASGTARAAFSTTAKELTDRIRSLAATIEETRRQALVQMTGVIDAVNEKAEALARVNQLIQASSAYGKPLPSADLLDERDRLTGQLVDLTGATVDTTDSGQATLRFDGLSLVEGNQAARLKPQFDGGSGSQAPLPSGLINVFLPRGEGSRNQGQGGLVATLGGSLVGGQFGCLMRSPKELNSGFSVLTHWRSPWLSLVSHDASWVRMANRSSGTVKLPQAAPYRSLATWIRLRATIRSGLALCQSHFFIAVCFV